MKGIPKSAVLVTQLITDVASQVNVLNENSTHIKLFLIRGISYYVYSCRFRKERKDLETIYRQAPRAFLGKDDHNSFFRSICPSLQGVSSLSEK